jgi:hypothetical protein
MSVSLSLCAPVVQRWERWEARPVRALSRRSWAPVRMTLPEGNHLTRLISPTCPCRSRCGEEEKRGSLGEAYWSGTKHDSRGG